MELTVTRPVSRRFFTAVLALLMLHLVLVWWVTALFLWRAETGLMVGGSWAAVARVAGPATDTWLAASSTTTDIDVARSMRRAGQKDVLVGLVRARSQLRLYSRQMT